VRRRTGLVLVAAVALLSGCGGQGPASGPEGSTTGSGRPAAYSSASPATPRSEAPRAKKPRTSGAQPSLPPGDPGLTAPSVPDPGTAAASPQHERARRDVPGGALLDAETVSMALGGTWQRHAGGGDECVRPEGALGERTMSYGGTDAGVVAETVATYRDAAAADEAVKTLGEAAAGCGWKVGPDPRLGSASVAAEDGPRALLGVSAEGVVVLLVGRGDVTKDAARWGSLVDLALGTSCPAAPDGCH